MYKLTICIATYNRSALLEILLLNIVEQIKGLNDVSILVVDGNSTDNTGDMVRRVRELSKRVDYILLKKKGGIDQDFDFAVRSSDSEYCWLFSDDDLMIDDAIKHIYDKLCASQPDMMVINSQLCDWSMTSVLRNKSLSLDADISLNLCGSDRDILFTTCSTYLGFIGSIVIKKHLWTNVNTASYYGSRFIHVGVISMLPENSSILILHTPFIRIRLGNAEWSDISFNIWYNLWPNLIWSFWNISQATKELLAPRDFFSFVRILFWNRAMGVYSIKQYREIFLSNSFGMHNAIALLFSLIPPLFPRLLLLAYAFIKGDKLLSYNLREGRKTKNSWKSAS